MTNANGFVPGFGSASRFAEDTSLGVLASFKLVKDKKNWWDAQKHCRALGPGWTLAGIHSQVDNAKVADLMHDRGVNDVWIGWVAVAPWTCRVGESGAPCCMGGVSGRCSVGASFVATA